MRERRRGSRRAEAPPLLWRAIPLPPLPLLLAAAAAMDAPGSIHNVFSTDRLWEKPSFFDPREAHEQSLFPPLQLDSEPSRLPREKNVDASC